MRTKTLGKILWCIAGFAIVLVFFSLPNHKELDRTNTQIAAINQQIGNVKKNERDLQNKSSIDLLKARNKAQKKLTDGVTLALGGIHSDYDLKNNKEQLDSDLTPSLRKKLISNIKDFNTHEYLVAQNLSTDVAFDTHNTDSVVNYTVLSHYKMTRDDAGNYVSITGKYDLRRQKVLTSSLKNINVKAPDTVEK